MLVGSGLSWSRPLLMPSLPSLSLQGRGEHLSKAKCHELLPQAGLFLPAETKTPSRKHMGFDARWARAPESLPQLPWLAQGQLGTSAALPKTLPASTWAEPVV